jgi:hypothetical protein
MHGVHAQLPMFNMHEATMTAASWSRKRPRKRVRSMASLLTCPCGLQVSVSGGSKAYYGATWIVYRKQRPDG